MDFTELYNQLISDFKLEALSPQEQEAALNEIGKTIQKQFLMDVYEKLGEAQFDALEKSAQMGEDFYATTLKHLLPEYEEVFQASREKVRKAFLEEK